MSEHHDARKTTDDEPDDIRHTTQEERDRAAAVHSVSDETRVHTDADETDLVQGAGGELRRPDDDDLGEGTPPPHGEES